jgi:hypothetical protein
MSGEASAEAGRQCPVCGYPALDEPAYSPVTGLGSYEICSSCGYEFGVTDDDRQIGHDEWRRRWVADGMPWRADGIVTPPRNWDPSGQPRSLPT